jgi:hypothetical protein
MILMISFVPKFFSYLTRKQLIIVLSFKNSLEGITDVNT